MPGTSGSTAKKRRPSAETPPARPLTMEWISSLLFWSQLLLAVALYAAVSLAPKLLVYVDLQNDFVKTQSQLVYLEQQVDELKKVVETLERDPRMIQELARIDLDAARPGEERIALSPDLKVQSRITQQRVHAPEVTRAWYMPLLTTFAQNHQLRTSCLCVAAALVLISFTFFQPSDLGAEGGHSTLGALAMRYRRRSSAPRNRDAA